VAEVPLTWEGQDPLLAGPEQRVANRELVVQALGALPPRMRAVLVLRFFDDLSERETAVALHCGVGTVKSQTSRGLTRLRELIDTATAETDTTSRSI
jgi:RNA polymerase sigma factor (sigma-70 family)